MEKSWASRTAHLIWPLLLEMRPDGFVHVEIGMDVEETTMYIAHLYTLCAA